MENLQLYGLSKDGKIYEIREIDNETYFLIEKTCTNAEKPTIYFSKEKVIVDTSYEIKIVNVDGKLQIMFSTEEN